ncbi:hypothetical protein TIFTF001_026378 [Ficus carica]|uniref:WAT1-related protein n=1 Tax=Ficus carica TaxID=3494 RepID=A0AA88DL42_FICCA|nr:hypothetical protein TIFTF001_026378 [Ficus carica]
MSTKSLAKMLKQAKPYLGVVLLQFGLAGLSIIMKFALNQGMSQHVLVVYRHAIAIALIAPFALVLERLEKVKIRRIHSQAKILGTIVTVGGAMFMTLVHGPLVNLPWTKPESHIDSENGANSQVSLKGALMIAAGCLSWSGFIVLQGSAVAVALEWGNPAAWSIHLDSKLFAAIYSGVVCSGFAYYIQGIVMKDKGPVFMTAFNPLSMVIVAILSSFILSETMYMGRVIGAVIIVAGLYMVLWGKSKDEPASESIGKTALLASANNGHMVTEINNENVIATRDQLVVVPVDGISTTTAGRNTDESV